MSKKLDLILEEGLRPSKPRIDFVGNEKAWMQWHQTQLKIPTMRPTQPAALEKQPLISVCIVHFNRPQHLARAIESVRRQDYSNFELILVDDGSTREDALRYLDQIEPEFLQRNWKLIRQENKSPGAARNCAARHARGEYLLFKDDDDIAEPFEFKTFIAVALKTNADILTCAVNMFKESDTDISVTWPTGIWLFLGAAVAAGALSNPFGGVNCLMRRSVYEKLGGFKEDRQIRAEDREFHTRAVLRGYQLQSICLPLFQYRDSPSARHNILDSALSQWRVIQTYQQESPAEFQNLFSLLGNLAAQAGALDSPDCPQKIVDHYWRSRSWRYTRPLRDLMKVLSGRPKESAPQVRTWGEAWEIISKIEDSASWNLTAPFRFIKKSTKKLRHPFRKNN